MIQVVVATGNRGKIKEIAEILEPVGIPVLAMGELGIHPDIDENGSSYLENARIKVDALATYHLENTIIMADDSGLDIDAMDHQPGIHSARFMANKPLEQVLQSILDRLSGLKGSERSARYHCALVLRFPDGTYQETEKVMEGEIGEFMAGENGFGYDPIFYVPQEGRMVAEMSDEEKNVISHRGQAIQWAIGEIRQWVSKHTGA